MSSPMLNYLPLTPKNRWAIENNYLVGFCVLAWLELLWTRRRDIDFRRYWFRIAVLSVFSVFNSAAALLESMLYGRTIKRQEIHPRPLFVLGHHRSGTTLLHTLLALNDEHFGYAPTFSVGFPSTFLLLGNIRRYFDALVTQKRPMDDMPLDVNTPSEEELGMHPLTAGRTAMCGMVFMGDFPSCIKYCSMKDAPDADRERWKRALLYILRKLSLAADGRRLVLKSPFHTARVSLLRQLFPDAQFVYLHRHPVRVYQSTWNLHNTAMWNVNLHVPSAEDTHRFILATMTTLWHEYAADRESIKRENLVEMSYDELTKDPVAAIERIYHELQLPGLERWRTVFDNPGTLPFEPKLNGYKKNKFAPLPALVREELQEAMTPFADEWGYSWDNDGV